MSLARLSSMTTTRLHSVNVFTHSGDDNGCPREQQWVRGLLSLSEESFTDINANPQSHIVDLRDDRTPDNERYIILGFNFWSMTMMVKEVEDKSYDFVTSGRHRFIGDSSIVMSARVWGRPQCMKNAYQRLLSRHTGIPSALRIVDSMHYHGSAFIKSM